MAETRLALTEVNGPYFSEAGTPQMTTVTGTAADATNGNVITLANDIILTCENTDVGAQTVTITSVADGYGRVADITAFSIPAGATVARRFTRVGWGNGNGDLVVNVSDVAILLTAYKL
jgi:hypothetical protein